MTQKSRCSSVVEHFLGKEEVKGSIPFNGSKKFKTEGFASAAPRNIKHNLKNR